MLLPFDHSFVSELQQEGISRYDCDSQKCPRPGPKPPSRIHYSNQTDHPKHPPPAPLRLGRLPQVPKTALCLVVQLEVAWLASIEADTARSPRYFLRLRTFGPRSGGGLNTNQLPKYAFYNKGTRQRNTKPSPPKDNSRSVDRITPLKF